MPDDFANALDRLDISLEDAADADALVERLSEILGYIPTQLQTDTARDHFRPQIQDAIAFGHQVTRFERQGRTVQVLRDARGRFVAQSDFLARPGQRLIVRGAGAIRGALQRLRLT